MSNLASVHWTRKAACKDHNLKQFASYDPDDITEAKLVCKGCEVQRECLVFCHELSCVTAGTSLYDRLLLRWQRIENEYESNWQPPENVFPKLFA